MRLSLNKEDISILNSEIFNTVYETLDNGKSIYGIDYIDGHSIAGLWSVSKRICSDNFLKRRDAFLWILEHLLIEGRIKLHKDKFFLESSIEDQIKLFKEAFPKDEHDADRICIKPGMEMLYEGFGMNVWWFLDSCPAGVAWRQDDGHYEIAD